MNVSEEKVIELALSVAGTAILALIGFVWKISHRVSAIEKTVESQKQINTRDINEVKRDIDLIYNSVDKNREWTTNRMMSIAKDLKQ